MGKSTKGDRDRVLYTVKWESLLGSGEREFASKDAAKLFIVVYLQHASLVRVRLSDHI